MTRLPLAPPLLLLFLTGCPSPVTFTAPCPNTPCQADAPVNQATMTFASYFAPGSAAFTGNYSLTLTFDGQTVTGLLTPPPAPNGTSTLALPQPPSPNYYTSPNHTLTASATCGFFCVYQDNTITFHPLNLSINPFVIGGPPTPGPLNFPLSAKLRAMVTVAPAPNYAPTPTVPVTLSATPQGMVAFATSSQGAGSEFLTVPVTGQAIVYLYALGQRGSFTVSGTAAGVQQVQVPGTVE